MAYELHNFEAGQILTAEALNAIETLLKANEDAIAALQEKVTALETPTE